MSATIMKPSRAALAALAILLPSIALARDNGQWEGQTTEIREWFNGLASRNGPCCSFADGVTIDDPDWRVTSAGTYQVFYHSKWLDVPPEALINGANRIGRAVLWPVDWPDERGTFIRCFMPGVEG